MRVRVYIAGPMTGYENFNREAFHKAEEELKREGHTVLNPAVLPDGLTQPHYMDICMAMIRCVDAIYMLKGWQRSAGAKAELALAEKLGVKNATLMWPVRIAASGKLVTPGGAVEICRILGRDETLKRLRAGLEKLS